MAGLLDFMDSDEARFGLSLLSAAGPQAVPASFGQRMASAMSSFEAQKRAEEERRAMQAYREMQTEALRQQAAERQLRAAELQRAQQLMQTKQEAAPNLFVSPAQAAMAGGAQAGSVGPTMANAQRMETGPQSPQFDVQAALRAGYTPEEIEKLAKLRDINMQRVARTIEGRDPQGRPVTMQVDEFGRPVGAPIQQWKAPVVVNQGDRQTFVDPATMGQVGQFGINMSPSERDASARGWASNAVAQGNLDVARSRLAFDQQGGGKPQFHDGAWYTPPTANNPQGSIIKTPGYAPPKGSLEAQQAASGKILDIIGEAEALIPKATGSYVGAGLDMAGRAIGVGTSGANTIAQLKGLEGALMMAQPRMEGPQSDKDVALYRQMAAQIGDPTLPTETKMAALSAIRRLNERYAGTPQTPTFRTPPPDAVSQLRMYRNDPVRRRQFDEVFGPGAADAALGGR